MEFKYFIMIGASALLLYVLIHQSLSYLMDRKFNYYFQLYSEENYNLDDLFHIKLSGKIIPKMDYLEIPYAELLVGIKTTAIQGEIKQNFFQLELIRPNDRKKALKLVKQQYMKAVIPYIRETVRSKKDDIHLIQLSKKQQPRIQKIACNTCKHKVQCHIAFEKCNYEREKVDAILVKGIKVDFRSSRQLNHYKK